MGDSETMVESQGSALDLNVAQPNLFTANHNVHEATATAADVSNSCDLLVSTKQQANDCAHPQLNDTQGAEINHSVPGSSENVVASSSSPATSVELVVPEDSKSTSVALDSSGSTEINTQPPTTTLVVESKGPNESVKPTRAETTKTATAASKASATTPTNPPSPQTLAKRDKSASSHSKPQHNDSSPPSPVVVVATSVAKERQPHSNSRITSEPQKQTMKQPTAILKHPPKTLTATATILTATNTGPPSQMSPRPSNSSQVLLPPMPQSVHDSSIQFTSNHGFSRFPPIPPVIPVEASPTSLSVRIVVPTIDLATLLEGAEESGNTQMQATKERPIEVQSNTNVKEQPAPKVELGFRLWLARDQTGPYCQVSEGAAESLVEVEVQHLRSQTVYWLKAELLLLKPYQHDGTYSEAVAISTTSSLPDIPAMPELTARSRNSLSLKFHVPKRNGITIEGYILLWDSGNAAATQLQEIYRGSKSSCKLTKLVANTPYRFQVAAFTTSGLGGWSPITTHTTSPTVPSRPEPPFVITSTDSSLTMAWNKPAGNGAPVTSFCLEMDDFQSGYFLSVYNGDSLQCIIQQLQRNHSYKFRLTASNSEGDSLPSLVVTYSTAPSVPSIPPAPRLTGIPRSDRVMLALGLPKDDGGAPIESFCLELREQHSQLDFETAYIGYEQPFLLCGLFSGCAYQVRLRCSNRVGFSDPSPILNFSTAPGVPFPPVLSIVKVNERSVDLAWEPEYDGGAQIHEYIIEQQSESTLETTGFQVVGTVPAVQQFFVATRMSPGRVYWLRVRARNACGVSEPSDYIEVLTRAAAPSTPVAPIMSGRTANSFALRWEPADGNGLPVTEYALEVCERGKNYTTAFRGNSLGCEVGQLQANTAYLCRLQAFNTRGASPWSQEALVHTMPSSPAVVTNVSFSGVTFDGASLRWAVPHDNGSPIERYRVIVLDDREEKGIMTLEPTEPSVQLTGLRCETSYHVRVQAVNAIGLGSSSRSIRLLTSPSRPATVTGLSIVSKTHNAIKLKWKTVLISQLECYVIELASDAEDSDAEWAEVLRCDVPNARIQKLIPNTKYLFRVAAVNSSGIGEFSEPIEATTTSTPPLAPPFNVVCEDNVFTLQWGVAPPSPSTTAAARKRKANKKPIVASNESITTDSQEIKIYELQETIGSETTIIYRGDATSYSLGQLRPGTTRTFRVRIVLPDVEGIWSEPRTVNVPLQANATKTTTTAVQTAQNNDTFLMMGAALIVLVGLIVMIFVYSSYRPLLL